MMEYTQSLLERDLANILPKQALNEDANDVRTIGLSYCSQSSNEF
jgi:hypothetical protein